MRPLYYDISQHQGKVNMQIVKDTSDGMLIMRGGISWGYEDPKYRSYYKKAGNLKINRMVYFVIYPDQPLERQINNWLSIAPNMHYPMIYDLELKRGMSNSHIGNQTWQACEIIKSRTGHYPLIYSRKNLLDSWLANWSTEQLNSVYYHLAQYLNDRSIEDTREIILPNRVNRNRVLFHQTCDKKPGPPGMVESTAVDYGRWLLTESFNDFAKRVWGVDPEFEEEPVPDPISPEIEDRLLELEEQMVRVSNQLNKLEFLGVIPLQQKVDFMDSVLVGNVNDTEQIVSKLMQVSNILKDI